MHYLQALSALFFLCGCCSYKIPTEEWVLQQPCSQEDPRLWEQKLKAARHPLYAIIPRHRSQIRWYDVGHWTTWMLFGNDEAGLFGEDNPVPFLIDHPVSYSKAVRWSVRNPLHNLTFYVLGSAYVQNSRVTLVEISNEGICTFQYMPAAPCKFIRERQGFLIALHGWKPFICLKVTYSDFHEGMSYIGWRDRGNLGVKFVPWTRTKRPCYDDKKDVIDGR